MNRTRATAPTTPPAMAASFDLEWDVGADIGGKEEEVAPKFGL